MTSRNVPIRGGHFVVVRAARLVAVVDELAGDVGHGGRAGVGARGRAAHTFACDLTASLGSDGAVAARNKVVCLHRALVFSQDQLVERDVERARHSD